jgi:Type II secretion system (T2SS), protein G
VKEENNNLWIILLIAGVCGVALVFLACGGGAALLIVRNQRDEARRSEACLDQIAKLDNAVEAYRVKYGEYPPSLEALLEAGPDGAPPLLTDPGLLVDPWGDSISYDTAGTMNNGTRPDIWVDQEDQSIGNWDLPRPRRR